MADRFAHMKLVYQSWDQPEHVLRALAPTFTNGDPAEPGPIGRNGFGDWMARFVESVRQAGGTGVAENLHMAQVDQDGVLHHWTWGRFPGTDLEGAALVTATDAGITRQRVACHRRPA